ncbi:nucleotidyltransferase domain-containing protein [Paenibacillus sp. PL91]|uniref:nucleotidyltransferase domain-containing protein n=1 Tax=Paenibacillus sp. PL91 TaxID=2729538 RepID=UPI00145E5B18|nr:nucleotidyltransferase domain-containing protein [Paenibacillus sp. PL91]MBC9200710.1 nucleotidyltransferase domain-containing protein [Paenibacillus sp. PL91]
MQDIESILEETVSRLQKIPGLEAIVLGGSRARGTHTPESDIDVGLYYASAYPIDTGALEEAAADLDDSRQKNLVTRIGEWGPWINGGGWLEIRSVPVDFLYRDLDKVSAVVDDCLQGKISVHYQAGHPHAFCSSIYMGEAAVCKSLWDPNGRIKQLKNLTEPYPDALKNAIVSAFLWEADFSLANARKGISRKDVSYVAGHLFRAVSCLTQILFAINKVYLLNEKGAIAACAAFPRSPDRFEARIRHSFTLLTDDKKRMESSIDEVEALVKETKRLLN